MTDQHAGSDQPPHIELRDPDGKIVSVGGATVQEQRDKVAALEDQWANRRGLAQFVDNFNDTVAALLANHWDFLDAYSSRIWPGQNGLPGDQWPQMPLDPVPPMPNEADPTTLAQAIGWVNRKVAVLVERDRLLQLRINVLDDRTRILVDQSAFVTYAQTREAHLFQLMLGVLAKQIERDPTLVPPDR